tara:strand:- start:169 stop:459 length:291 start_codon:yes stop_codon:yes gene_type:complete
MTVRQLIEYVQQHHPHMGESEILDRVNRALEGVARSTNLLSSTFTGTTVADKRYYTLNSKVSVVDKVSIDGLDIPRIPEPSIDDTTDESAISEESN